MRTAGGRENSVAAAVNAMSGMGFRHRGASAPYAEIQSAQSASPLSTRRSALKIHGSCSGNPDPNPVRMGKPIIQAQTCRTPAALSPGASGNPVKRVFALRSLTRPQSISIVRTSRRAADQTATPNFADRSAAASASISPERAPESATGLPFTRARRAASHPGKDAASDDIVSIFETLSAAAPASARISASSAPSQNIRRSAPSAAGGVSARVRRSGIASRSPDSTRPSPTSSTTSPRVRASPGVVSIIPLSRKTSRSRNKAAEDMWSTTPPIRSQRAMAACAPATSAPRPATTVRRLFPMSPAASAMAASNGAARPLIEDCDIPSFPLAPRYCLSPARADVLAAANYCIQSVIFDVGEPLIRFRRSLQCAAGFPRPPLNHFLDFFRELEVLVRDPLGGVVHEPNLDPRVRRRDIRVMPCRLGEMTDGVDHHQRALPTVRLILPTNPTAFVTPMRKIALQSRGDFFLRIRSLGRFFGHSTTPRAFHSAKRVLHRPPKSLVENIINSNSVSASAYRSRREERPRGPAMNFLHATAPAGVAVTVSAASSTSTATSGDNSAAWAFRSASRADASHCVAPARLGSAGRTGG